MAATQSQVFSTSDLRSSAKEAQRDIEHKAKWARGGRHAAGKRCPEGMSWGCACNDRPLAQPSRNARRADRVHTQRVINHAASASKAALRHDLNTDDLFGPPSDSSADEDVHDASAAPEPASDAGVMYSYDVSHGPAKGSQILSLAINKAVERFENKETEKLAKEYEFIDARENDADGEYSADDDDFELVEHDKI